MTNGNEVRENFILRLFDTIKDSNTNVANIISKQTDAIDSLGDACRDDIQNEEIKRLIETHTKESEGKMSKLLSRVNLMIACVCIAFGLIAISYFVVRSSVDTMISKRLEQHNIVMNNDEENRNGNHEGLERKINEILRRIEELHKDDKKDNKYGPTK